MFYYSDSLKVFTNRIDAIKNPEPCYFYFHDDVYSKLDWTIEPQETLPELYLRRALQIREKYDYLILAYSGGLDSSNILETFYYNNIHINEILMVGAFSQDSYTGSDENHNGEIYHQAIPTLKNFNLPNTKITQVDYTTYFNDIKNFPIITNYGSDWTKNIGTYYSPHNFFWSNLKNLIGRDNDKNTGVIFGCDKPGFYFDGRRPYTYFCDSVMTQYGNFQRDQNFERVNFYIDPLFPDINKKQLHMIFKFFVQNVYIDKTMSLVMFMKNYDRIMHSLIYKLRNPITYKSGKSKTSILSLRDMYILDDKSSDIYKIYLDGIKKMNLLKEDYITKKLADLKTFRTKSYYLCEKPLYYYQ